MKEIELLYVLGEKWYYIFSGNFWIFNFARFEMGRVNCDNFVGGVELVNNELVSNDLFDDVLGYFSVCS